MKSTCSTAAAACVFQAPVHRVVPSIKGVRHPRNKNTNNGTLI